MPQISVEHSAGLGARLDVRAVAAGVHRCLVEHAGADLEACKTRLVRLDDVVIGDGDPRHAMVHVDVGLLRGRTHAQRAAVGRAVLALLEDAVADVRDLDVQLTVEVRELDADHYHKVHLRG